MAESNGRPHILTRIRPSRDNSRLNIEKLRHSYATYFHLSHWQACRIYCGIMVGGSIRSGRFPLRPRDVTYHGYSAKSCAVGQ